MHKLCPLSYTDTIQNTLAMDIITTCNFVLKYLSKLFFVVYGDMLEIRPLYDLHRKDICLSPS